MGVDATCTGAARAGVAKVRRRTLAVAPPSVMLASLCVFSLDAAACALWWLPRMVVRAVIHVL